ncbi:UNVERIFIED_CONTAM: hypothetical protein FKN15_060173 [Acipenser sinensis]
MAPRPQRFTVFPDFMEEVRSFWDSLALGPSVHKQAAPFASLEGAEKLGLAGFPPVDHNIMAPVKALSLDCGLIVARRQLWLSQARVPDADKTALLDMPISPGHTFGTALEEILQRSYWKREASRQVVALLIPRTSTWGRSNHWRAPQTWTVTRTVPVRMALLGDLRHHLQGTPAANNRAHSAGRGNAGHGQPTHQCPRRRFQGQRPRQPPPFRDKQLTVSQVY